MRRFSGVGGTLYALGERFAFDTALQDCGDGWDWRAPEDLSYWVVKPTITIYPHGEMIVAEPVECFLTTGRIGLGRNMSHGAVYAAGACLPISRISGGDRWEIQMNTVTPEINSLGEDHVQTKTKIIGTTGILEGFDVPITKVLARFPLGYGVFTGIGTGEVIGSKAHIQFPEGVEYVPR